MQQFTLAELWSHMGLFARLIIYLLAIMGLASIVVMAERFISFVKSNKDSRRYATNLAQTIEQSGVEAAAREPQDEKSSKEAGHLGRTLGAGLAAFRMTRTAGTTADLTIESVARALERQAQRENQNLRRGINLLATVGSTAPFVGLLGTVVGIINAFHQMAASGSGGLATVSAGISEALVATAFGLLVAIPAVMAFNFMQGWVDARMVDMTESSNELLDTVARKLDEGSAAPARAV